MFKIFYPKRIADSAYAIDYEELYEEGYRGLIFDIDNTLVEHDADASPEAIELISRLRESGFKVCLISNNDKERVERFNRDIKTDYIYNGKKPLKKNYYKAMEKMGTNKNTTVFIGDQLFTDVWGANRVGLMTYFVKPISPREEVQIVLKRKLERIVLRFYRKDMMKDKGNINIILVGFMASGKTTVGQYLAKKISYNFKDTDILIEEEEGMTISQIFEEKGQEYFRGLETNLLGKLGSSLNKTVLATGGGMPLRKENQEALTSLGHVVYLKATSETILKRVSGDNTRPLLEENPEESVRILLKERQAIYSKVADKVVETDKKTIEEICSEILFSLK